MKRSKSRDCRVRRRAAFAAAIAVSATAHAAQDLTRLPLESLMEMRVIAVSSYEQSIAEAPAAVSIITAEEIRSLGYRTIAEALRSLPGLYVSDDLSYAYLGSRGFNRIGDYNSRFQLSLNGLRTNDALYDMAYLGSDFPLDMALIERIEFAPGPGSSIYGSNAMLGVINIVTRTATALRGLRVAPAIGSNGTREVAMSFGHRFDSGVEVLASASGLRSAGQDFHFPIFDAPATNAGVASGQAGEHYRRGYLRATYEGFDLEVLGGRRDKNAPSLYLGNDFLSPDNRLVDAIALAALRYHREIARDTRLEARLSSASYEYTGVYPLADGIKYRDDASARWHGAELRVVSSYWDRHKIVAGAELQVDSKLDQRSAGADAVDLDRHDQSRRAALYLQDEFRVNAKWLVNAGARYDRHYSFGSSLNPRIALIGEIAEATSIKLLYGSAFRAPNAYELYYTSAPTGTTLGPERSTSAEAVIEQQVGEHWRWRASAFSYRFEDLIDLMDTNGVIAYRNRGQVKGRGVELSVVAMLAAGVRASASSSIADVRQDDGRRATNSPRFTAKFALRGPLGGTGVLAAAEVIAVGERLDRERQPVVAAFTTNLVFTSQDPWHGARFTLGFYNLFDRRNMEPMSEYYTPTQVPSLARTIRLGVEWRY